MFQCAEKNNSARDFIELDCEKSSILTGLLTKWGVLLIACSGKSEIIGLFSRSSRKSPAKSCFL
jgi:hypothetical protein